MIDFIRTPLIVTVIRRIAFAPVLLCTACAFDSYATSNTTFEEIFTKVRAVELEERDPDPLIGIRDLDILPDGRLLVVDRHAGRLRIFSADGAIDTVIGRFGEGPGEFRQPNAAAVGLDGRILVTQATPRVTLLTPDGSVERIGTLPGWLAGDMEPLGSGFVGYISKYGWEGAILDLNGELVDSFPLRDQLVREIPYWISFVSDRVAVARDHIIGNSSFFPTLKVFNANGDFIREFGEPPPSWVEPIRPERGAFMGPDAMEQARDWLGAFTVVTELNVLDDSLVLVQYGRHEPNVNDMHYRVPTRLDVYHFSGVKIYEDLMLTKRMLAADSLLYVLEAMPPEPWTVGVYRPRF